MRACLRVQASTLAVALLLLRVNEALARPGGGGSYHGGAGGGRGGGSFGGGGIPAHGGYQGSGGGSGDPLIGVVFFVVVLGVWLALLVLKARRQALDRGAFGALQAAQYDRSAAVRAAVSLAPLQARDAALTTQSLVDHIVPMADLLRQAWCGGDMRPARAFVSDGVYGRFQVQLALMRQEGRCNVMSDARVLQATLEGVEDAAPLEVVHLRVTAEARDTEVAVGAGEADVRAALGRVRVEPYTEIWSLVRRQGAQSKPAGFAVGRACPSCGAPLDEGEILQCRYCGALVCSGEHDWVLAEITQLEEWHPTARRPAGLDELHARDPGATREVLEDRASFLFWKWVQSGRENSPAPLRKYAAAALLAQGARVEWTRGASDVAVGGADLLRCDLDGEDGFDRAYVKIHWSARFGGSRAYTPAQTVLRLARRTGVASRPSMTALVCQACGAPLAESDSSRCDHCGAELAAGDQAWVTEAVLRVDEVPPPPAQAEGTALAASVPDVADPRERRVLFARMAQLMAVNGAIVGKERRLLQMCAARWGIAAEPLQQVLQHPPQGDYADAMAVQSPDWFLAGLVAAAMADGRIDPRERAMLERACDALHLPRESIDRQIAATSARVGGA